ncbi:MAG: TolB family protein, partial [Gemmatimonadales bacterium]
PDGEWIGFGDTFGGVLGLRRIAVTGGPVLNIADATSFLGSDWRADGSIVYVPALGSSGVWMMADDGSGSRQVTTVLDSLGETGHAWPQFLPDGKSLLFTVGGPSGGWSDGRIVVQDITSGERHAEIEGATYGRYVRTGHIVYAQADGTILAAPFDLGGFEVGDPFPVASDVRVAAWGGGASFAVSDGGTFAFVQGTNQDYLLSWLDREGTLVRQLGPPLNGAWPTISPDGSRVAFTLREPDHNDIWLADAATGRREHFTLLSAEDESPMWSPDGQQIAYSTAGTGESRRIYIKPVDGSSEPELIYTGEYHLHLTDWSPDGEWLAFDQLHPETGNDVLLVSADGAGRLLAVDTTRAQSSNPVFSPDGEWLAYASDESGRLEVYAVPFPELTPKTFITVDGGSAPRWNEIGDELFYLGPGDTITVVSVNTQGPSPRPGPPRPLFPIVVDYPFDVAPDGQHFVVLTPNPDAPAREIQIVLNWLEELEAKVGN